MKSKKILASLMAVSIIGSSSFVLGGSAKAATLNSKDNNYVSYVSVQSFGADISRSGYLVWDNVNAYKYEVDVTGSSQAYEAVFNSSIHSTYIGSSINKVGTYSVDICARNSSSTVIGYTHFNIYYNGSTFSRV
ncbi:hypothetical protein [Clostridium sp. JS66]|uniref:hypothetical protein n=1 Tax=Clostridium sp. JS66 TaxID=3064705 RepID=UPI00298E62B4|nr:hypothetical protein [Clostridium sp. JS66]WPC42336.1 hypothetical protein Q6H37_02390 [Clostridium sp. JS66]